VHIVEKYIVKIDRQGRLVIPSKVRKILGLKPNAELLLEIRNNTIILEPINKDMEKTIDEWYKKMVKLSIESRGIEIKKDPWMSEEYVKRKLGID